MIFAALDEAAEKDELLLVEGGLCRFHLRRDGVVTIRELLVLTAHRGRGTGRMLVETVAARHYGAVLRAACPASYKSNGFWRHMGFELKDGNETRNLWQRPASFSAPTGTRPSPAPR